MIKPLRSLAIAAVVATCGAPPAGFAQAAKPATIWYSEQFIVHSKNVGRDLLIEIARPIRPHAGKFPAIYLLDGNSLFGEVADMVVTNGYFGDTADAYVVGIGYPAPTIGQWLSLRNHDLIHVRGPDNSKTAIGSGEGAKFEKFLLEEVRPLIGRRYSVNAHRAILAGHSFGGLFTLHVLLNDLGAFNDYLICSPSIWAEPRLLEKASDFHASMTLKVFIGLGSKEETQLGEDF
jgi:predicted alpha/beta superfamily hydrolase